MVTSSFNVVAPSTLSVVSKSTAPLLFKSPSFTALPVAEAIVNLSVVPERTAKLPSTSTVPLNSELSPTVRVPTISVLPVAPRTLNLTVSPVFFLPTNNPSPEPVPPTCSVVLTPAPPKTLKLEAVSYTHLTLPTTPYV